MVRIDKKILVCWVFENWKCSLFLLAARLKYSYNWVDYCYLNNSQMDDYFE